MPIPTVAALPARAEGVDTAQCVVCLDHPAPFVARLRINRPDKRNAIDHAVRQALIDELLPLQADTGVRALVFGGMGGVFSAGGDLPSMAGLDQARARARIQHVHRLCALVGGLGIPVVSAVEGIAAGAAVGLALLGDFIVVGPGTKILFPFLKLGLAPDWGQVFTLPQRVGGATARRLFTAGSAVGGEEALRIGLADTLVADDRVMEAAVQQALALTQLARSAFGCTKDRLNRPSASLAEELAREETDAVAGLLGPEFAEGHAAFMDKRPPQFLPGLYPAADTP
ncbi:MAG: enoyl-CoA hydratase/isomerase family protein [Chitinophagaceae bacterium]|nr:enoyl-CoA hydratase/isomerase family protein [Rubrivivax sp.]